MTRPHYPLPFWCGMRPPLPCRRHASPQRSPLRNSSTDTALQKPLCWNPLAPLPAAADPFRSCPLPRACKPSPVILPLDRVVEMTDRRRMGCDQCCCLLGPCRRAHNSRDGWMEGVFLDCRTRITGHSGPQCRLRDGPPLPNQVAAPGFGTPRFHDPPSAGAGAHSAPQNLSHHHPAGVGLLAFAARLGVCAVGLSSSQARK